MFRLEKSRAILSDTATKSLSSKTSSSPICFFRPHPIRSFTSRSIPHHSAGAGMFGGMTPVTSLQSKQSRFMPQPGIVRDTLRPFKGLDMDKLYFGPHLWSDPYKPAYPPVEMGHEGGGLLPVGAHVNTMTDDELATFYDCQFWWEKYDWKQIGTAVARRYRFYLYEVMHIVMVLSPVIVCTMGFWWFEPREQRMDADEYFDNYWWIMHGNYYDHHRASEWREARRARRWRELVYPHALEYPREGDAVYRNRPKKYEPKDFTKIPKDRLPEDLQPVED